MRFSAYVTAEGRFFDPQAFNRRLPPQLQGEVKERKHVRFIENGPERFYWRSIQVETEQNPEIALSALLTSLLTPLKRIADDDSVRICAQVVVWQTEHDDARGFYVPANTLAMLAAVRADLDIDVVHDLKQNLLA